MRRSFRNLILMGALCGGLPACSLFLDFDPEGQLCDERNQCLAGYTCQDGECLAGGSASDAGVTDAGPDGGGDAGTDAGPDAGGDAGTDAGPVP